MNGVSSWRGPFGRVGRFGSHKNNSNNCKKEAKKATTLMKINFCRRYETNNPSVYAYFFTIANVSGGEQH
jgi:hypothetical protein